MNWGKGIILSFVTFAVFVIALVVVCMRQNINLVSDDYYKDELRYQDQIDRMNNAASLTVKPVITVANDRLAVDFGAASIFDSASVKLFRPSDDSLDKKFRLDPANGGHQTFRLAGMRRGMYKLLLTWSSNGKEFYMEQTVEL